MESQQQPVAWSQAALFEGGYESIRCEFSCYLHGTHDQVQVNLVVRDPATTEWIAAEVPTTWLDARDHAAVGEFFADALLAMRKHLRPF